MRRKKKPFLQMDNNIKTNVVNKVYLKKTYLENKKYSKICPKLWIKHQWLKI